MFAMAEASWKFQREALDNEIADVSARVVIYHSSPTSGVCQFSGTTHSPSGRTVQRGA
ncbi:hypothetical protein K439DRAFT_141567 [Ramaria rubella]|nr:hypothetical protein K439DRAFT_141567 [Ramaria rubella]